MGEETRKQKLESRNGEWGRWKCWRAGRRGGRSTVDSLKSKVRLLKKVPGGNVEGECGQPTWGNHAGKEYGKDKICDGRIYS
jgi:hypothetical protein